VKSRREPAALVSGIRAEIAALDKEQPIVQIATMQEVVNASIFTRRVTLIVLGLFSGLALAVASIGIYGVVSYSVALTHSIAKLLYGVSAVDPATFASVAALLALIAMFACYIPARRAAMVDPTITLRHE
jgi:putative ABC transport system permease protein